MKTSSLIRSISTEIKIELHINTTARPNYAAITRLNRLANELERVSPQAAKTAEHLFHVADHYYGTFVCEKLPYAAEHLHSEMLTTVNQIESVADHYAANGD